MHKPVVGQQLFSLNIGNEARFKTQVLTPVVVKRVGRLYFYAGKIGGIEHNDVQYRLNDWREHHSYSQCSKLFTSELAWAEHKEAVALKDKLRETFNDWSSHMSIHVLRSIDNIVEANKETE